MHMIVGFVKYSHTCMNICTLYIYSIFPFIYFSGYNNSIYLGQLYNAHISFFDNNYSRLVVTFVHILDLNLLS